MICVDLNVTSEVIGNFGTIVNTGNFFQAVDSEIEYQATVRGSNTTQNTNGQQVSVDFDVFANGKKQENHSFSLQVINH